MPPLNAGNRSFSKRISTASLISLFKPSGDSCVLFKRTFIALAEFVAAQQTLSNRKSPPIIGLGQCPEPRALTIARLYADNFTLYLKVG